ncbi:MAG: hypothetical protein GXP05_08145 [Alphaproteobacteria bacterium]|nr:hypothetical protein [Alphaproteobacteria bacterium]
MDDVLFAVENEIIGRGLKIDTVTSTHVGGPDSYLAICAPKTLQEPADNSYTTPGGLNHVGIVVVDINTTKLRVKEAGYRRSHR